MELLTPDFGTFFWMLVSFIIVFVTATKFSSADTCLFLICWHWNKSHNNPAPSHRTILLFSSSTNHLPSFSPTIIRNRLQNRHDMRQTVNLIHLEPILLAELVKLAQRAH